MNQPGEARNTQHGIRKSLAKNREEVKEDPSEVEGIEAFEVKGTEAFKEESTDAFPGEVNSKARRDKGQGGSCWLIWQGNTRYRGGE